MCTVDVWFGSSAVEKEKRKKKKIRRSRYTSSL